MTAVESARSLAVTAAAFRRLCASKPGVEHALCQILGAQVDRLSHRVLELLCVGLDRRVYRRLFELAASYGGSDRSGPASGTIVVPFTQAQLADLTGGTRPSVNQALQRLVEDGVVRLGRGRVEVLDLPGLRRRCGQ